MLEISTTSSSIIPIFPTPALVRNSATGQPKPPAPTIKTFASFIFSWPFEPISLSIICLENLSISLLLSDFFIFLLSQNRPHLLKSQVVHLFPEAPFLLQVLKSFEQYDHCC